ncbi:hypothetical protein CAL12_17105 [Bordetella genomosp. 8]|uniref:Phosphoglycerate mutase n=1 Tax=Bordetella genomosp. 8 TaxID=1416806 RepID=A0A1W6YMR8_9BORD|nr:hypothetical protein [Bordetella genomosp. 8]ARP82367.1 hypothetical protein CAL12_17105 [Bordetella genomosp. 8]
MQIVLPGVLPPSAPIAAELAKRLPTVAPTLYAWMRLGAGRQASFDPHDHGCTPYEAWRLEQAGFRPAAGQPMGAGLGPLLATEGDDHPASGDEGVGAPASATAAGSSAGEPVWIADLAHIALGTDRASLVPAQALEVTAAEGAALFESARPLFDGTPFDAIPLRPYRWRVAIPAGMALPSASPDVVAGQPLNTWWTQDASARPWRRLLNEIQMAWYDHPVNEQRMARGQLPVNGIWLYGGALPWPATPAASAPAAVPPAARTLLAASQAEDWAAWLQAIERLDAETLKPLADAQGHPLEALNLTLLGRDRRATLALRPRHPLLRWLPAREQSWRAWWSPPV